MILSLIIYLIVGLVIAVTIIRMETFGWVWPSMLTVLWLPVLLLAVLAFVAIRLFPAGLLHLIGWRLEPPAYPMPAKSIMVMAPHTSSFDAFIGKLGLLSLGIPHNLLISFHLFKFPFTPFLKYGLQAVPVGNSAGRAILEIDKYLKSHDTGIVICPEGQLAPTDNWNPGFYVMARKSGVPIQLTTLDYRHKLISFYSELIDPAEVSRQETYELLRTYYKDAHACHPEKFLLPKLPK